MTRILFCTLLLAASLGARTAEPFRIYYLGNSLTDELKYDSFKELAAAGGHPVIWGRHMIPGAPIRWLWTHPKDGFSQRPFGPTATAFDYQWDAVTLQPFSGGMSDLPNAIDYVRRIQEKSPQAQIYVYAQWPARRSQDWSKMWLQDYTQKEPASDMSRSFYEAFLLKLRESTKTEKPILLIPVGHAMYLLH